MELKVGMSESISKTISEYDVYGYAGIVGDFNSVHINKQKASESKYGQRIVHGMLVGSFISAVLGTKLPGEGTIYLEQNLKFKQPVYFEDTITAIVTVSEIINEQKGIYRLETIVKNQDEAVVVDGYAVVKYTNT